MSEEASLPISPLRGLLMLSLHFTFRHKKRSAQCASHNSKQPCNNNDKKTDVTLRPCDEVAEAVLDVVGRLQAWQSHRATFVLGRGLILALHASGDVAAQFRSYSYRQINARVCPAFVFAFDIS